MSVDYEARLAAAVEFTLEHSAPGIPLGITPANERADHDYRGPVERGAPCSLCGRPRYASIHSIRAELAR